MDTQIVKVQSTTVIRTLDDAERAAKAMAQSGFFADTRAASQAVVKILAGQELGFGPFASMTGVHIIENKPVISANLMAAAVKRTGKYNYRVVKHSDQECEIDFFEGQDKVGSSRFTMQDAERAGVSGKGTWKKYPRNLLFARALSNGQKWFAPDVFGGATVYTPEEMGEEVDEEGNYIHKPEEVLEIVPAEQGESELPQAVHESPDQTEVVYILDAKAVQKLVDLRYFENGYSAAHVLGRFDVKKMPIGKLIEKVKIYRDWKEYLIKSAIEQAEATTQAIDHANKNEACPQIPGLEGAS